MRGKSPMKISCSLMTSVFLLRRLPVTCLIRAMGLREDGDILDTFGGDPTIRATLEKDSCKSYEEALLEIYRKLRPGEPAMAEGAHIVDRRKNVIYNDVLGDQVIHPLADGGFQLIALVLVQQLLEDQRLVLRSPPGRFKHRGPV